ncbi:unnamed protein product [Parnassius apollo]|uniref:(apollo) hypothetical protein n=1 Tax=Parnassius apollo TaxID=110799 RepID=A0A8S3XMY4_PARAO|nr:unnamed protein product [Parnassius apollo]
MHTLLYISLLLPAAVLINGYGMFFKVESTKGYGYSKPNIILGPFYIPDKQCSGVVYNLTQACEYLDVVKVTVVDAQAYPEVTIDSLLERATVKRRAGPRGCVGRVTVQVTVGCGDSTRRSARSLPDSLQAGSPLLPLTPLEPLVPTTATDKSTII